MDTKKAKELLDKFNKGTLSPDEEAMLDSWYLSLHKDEEVSITDENLQGRKLAVLSKLDSRYNKRLKIKLWPRIAVAASRSKFGTSLVAAAAVAAITLGVWLYNISNTPSRHPELVSGSQDIAPGKNGATITLANGKVIQLSDAKSGVVIGGGKIAYSSLREGTTKQSHDEIASIPRNDVMQMTASTAKGQTYQFTLPDGTKVWLNADSKISFPSQFVGKERKILLDGEAYFEVSKVYVESSTLSPRKGDLPTSRGKLSQGERGTRVPFIVATDKQEVEVLGTHFNINSYKDEGSVRTTLLEGSVRVSSLRGGTHETSSGQAVKQSPDEVAASRKAPRNDEQGGEGNSIILKPNQQSVISGSNRITVKQVDVNESIGWKDGDFVFRNDDFKTLMRKVARWYNVEIIYDKSAPSDLSLLGEISRSKNISAILNIMEATGDVHFKIEGRRVIVTK